MVGVENTAQIDSVGWQTDVDSLGIAMDLPPGWRMLALFGPDRVDGDWLTAWSLLDLFLLLIFGLAVTRIWGIPAGIIAFLAFGLAYHEPGSPRLTWLFLLMPVALLKVVPEGTANKWLKAWKYLAMGLLLINLIPFLGSQIQSALYPQLERSGVNYRPRPMFQPLNLAYQRAAKVAEPAFETDDLAVQSSLPFPKSARQQAVAGGQVQARFESSNLLYDAEAKIQTGPAEPKWRWNRVRCYWDGPVTVDQQIRPVMLSLNQNRVVTLIRIVLLAVLVWIVIGITRIPFFRSGRRATAAAMISLCCLTAVPLSAQEIPDQEILQQLRQRLLEADDAFPRAAEISSVDLVLKENRIAMSAEIHAATRVAVPLPGKLPDWTPLTVRVDNQAAELVCRRQDYLWVVLPAGVHEVTLEAMLPAISEWEWTFLLPPKRVKIDAAGWNVTGVRDNGVPEDQVFFARQQQAAMGEAAYDRKDFSAILAVDRYLEIGLTWQVRNQVSRLSRLGKAVSIQVPLLPGERVLSSNVVVEDGNIEVRLGADQQEFSWQSELTIGQEIQLQAADTQDWVERWHLVASPVWNVTTSGLAPVFESQERNLIPVWHPWPGESVILAFGKPAAVEGQTVTVRSVNKTTELGTRQRTSRLKLELECSLGTDFRIGLKDGVNISSVKVDGQPIPERRDDGDLVIPVKPGKQNLEVDWRENVDLKTVVQLDHVSLPVDAANITSIVRVPASRWIWWTDGPTRGPAVRFWVILTLAVLIALLLGGVASSPLNRFEWVLLAIGLTQIHVAAALIVVVWLFASLGEARPT